MKPISRIASGGAIAMAGRFSLSFGIGMAISFLGMAILGRVLLFLLPFACHGHCFPSDGELAERARRMERVGNHHPARKAEGNYIRRQP